MTIKYRASILHNKYQVIIDITYHKKNKQLNLTRTIPTHLLQIVDP